jgi:hypothetical protein
LSNRNLQRARWPSALLPLLPAKTAHGGSQPRRGYPRWPSRGDGGPIQAHGCSPRQPALRDDLVHARPRPSRASTTAADPAVFNLGVAPRCSTTLRWPAPLLALQWRGTRDTPLRWFFFRGGRKSTGVFGFTPLSHRRRRQASGREAASWPDAMDGGPWRWAWALGSTMPQPPPTAPYPLALAWAGHFSTAPCWAYGLNSQ